MEKLVPVLYILISVLLSIGESFAIDNTPSGLFERANQFYREDNYTEAVKRYNQILKEGWESGELYYNLGNAYYKSGKLGLSILYYEKARIFLPRDADLHYNLKMVSSRVADRIEVPRLAFWRTFDKIRDYLTINTVAVITLILYIASIALIALYVFQSRGKLKRLFFYSTTPFIIAFLFFLSLFIIRAWRAEHISEGVILAEKVEVLSAPDKGSTGLFSIHEGLKVRLKQHLPPWVEIVLPDGKRGWMEMENIGEI